MDHAKQVEQIKQIFHQLDNDTCVVRDTYAINGSKDYYTSPAQLARERQVLFRRTPVVVGTSDQVREPGDFFTSRDLGIPLLVVRGRNGRLNAFLNSCTHRASAVEMERCGKGRKVFTCPFHAWSFDTEGNLVGLPEPWGFPGLDKAEHHLVTLPVAERHGLIWVLGDPEGVLDLDALLGPLDDEFAQFGLEDYRLFDTNVRTLNMNWKIALDTFGESYHVQALHKQTALTLFHSTVCTVETYGRHSRMLATRRSLEQFRESPEADWRLLPHATMVYLIFPNTVLLWQVDHVELFRLYPLGDNADQTLLYTSVLSPGPVKSEQEQRHWTRQLEFLVTVTEEDFSMGPTIHEALSTGLMEQVVFGTYEAALIHLHTNLRQALGLEPLQFVEAAAPIAR